MKIKLTHPEHGVILSDTYPDTEEVRDNAMEAINRCLLGEQSSIIIRVNENLVVIPADVVKQSVITFVSN